MLKVSRLVLVFSLLLSSSCSFRNDSFVTITIDSEPVDASIFVDGTYYGKTISEVRLVPDKDYTLELKKEGYRTLSTIVRSKFTMRARRPYDRSKCRLDLLGSILIFPLISLKSVHCRDFVKDTYNFELEPDPYYVPFNMRRNQSRAPYYPTQSYALPNRFQQNVAPQQMFDPKNNQSQLDYSNSPYNVDSPQISPSGSYFNANSEFANDGQSSDAIDTMQYQNYPGQGGSYYGW